MFSIIVLTTKPRFLKCFSAILTELSGEYIQNCLKNPVIGWVDVLLSVWTGKPSVTRRHLGPRVKIKNVMQMTNEQTASVLMLF